MWDFFVVISPRLVLGSLPIYCISAAASSILVCNRAKTEHLLVGLKVAGGAFVASIILAVNISASLNFGLLIVRLFCYIIGGSVGAYYVLKKQIRRGDRSNLS
jgi:hypothetical protein